MSQKFRQPEGGRIDRGEPLSFTFDGQTYEGYRGDPVASALLANDVRLIPADQIFDLFFWDSEIACCRL